MHHVRLAISLLAVGATVAVAAIVIGPQPVAGSNRARVPDCGPAADSGGVVPARRELLPSAGTATLVKDIYPGADHTWNCAPANLVAVGDRVFFTADDGQHGRELWHSDGTRPERTW